MTYLWTKLSGPGTVTFVDATALTTHADFSDSGVYILRLTVTNGTITGIAHIKVVVLNLSNVPSTDPVIDEQNP